MGMDAKVNIWVGVRVEDCGDWDDLDEMVKSKIPKDFFEDDDEEEYCDLWRDSDAKSNIEKYGFSLKSFSVGEEDAGYGVKVFGHNWDFGSKEFNCGEVQIKIDTYLPLVEKYFKSWGIDIPISVWCQTDWS